MRGLVWLTNSHGFFRGVPQMCRGLRLVIDNDRLRVTVNAVQPIDIALNLQSWVLGPWWYIACALDNPGGHLHVICRRSSPEAVRLAHQLAKAQ